MLRRRPRSSHSVYGNRTAALTMLWSEGIVPMKLPEESTFMAVSHFPTLILDVKMWSRFLAGGPVPVH
jgi:hypothetical protein